MTIINLNIKEYNLTGGVTDTWLRLGFMIMYDDNKGLTFIARMGPLYFYIDK